jgi:hypothetical protein
MHSSAAADAANSDGAANADAKSGRLLTETHGMGTMSCGSEKGC